jgi:glycosyltransferase involved in cell wall biosynthesis
MIVAGDFTPLGGMDVANYALARYLGARDAVHLVTHRAWDDLRGTRMTVDCVPRPFGAHAVGAPLLDHAGRRAWARRRASDAHAIVNGGNCRIDGAICWVHYLHAAYDADVYGSPVRRAKQVVVSRRDRAAEAAVLNEASLVICNSARTREDVLRAYSVEASRVHVVYYGVDPIRFGPVTAADRKAAKRALGCTPDRPLVGFVGALGDRRKAFDTLFAAWCALCRDPRWDADLMVVGAGAELDAWRELARHRLLGDRVRFAGFRRDVPDVLAAFDALVHPARYEAYGLSAHEALCRGVPTLVTKTAGVAEQYPAALTDLLIANPDDADEVRARLEGWRSRMDVWRDVTAGAAAKLRQRTWDVMASEIVALAEAA